MVLCSLLLALTAALCTYISVHHGWSDGWWLCSYLNQGHSVTYLVMLCYVCHASCCVLSGWCKLPGGCSACRGLPAGGVFPVEHHLSPVTVGDLRCFHFTVAVCCACDGACLVKRESALHAKQRSANSPLCVKPYEKTGTVHHQCALQLAGRCITLHMQYKTCCT
ncbi:hypothetical protein COO60DRAFT_437491 [Scenedesmus sp. NREL 46B-D3]|nr:hypothetical protein COO60DRAFT_437491 [Scenedesmus sp. NREL 46B-D3]